MLDLKWDYLIFFYVVWDKVKQVFVVKFVETCTKPVIIGLSIFEFSFVTNQRSLKTSTLINLQLILVKT